MKKHIFLASPHMSEEGFEQGFIKEAFESNWIAPLGKNVTELENEMIAKIGGKKAIALSSGTAAIHLALKAADVRQGDIVFCQSLTFSATANPIIYERAIPVFIDSEEDTWNMCPNALEKAFQKYEMIGKRPKAVIVVHLYGMCAKIEEIVAICKKYNIVLIEDAAESLGTTYNEQYTGTFGDYGILSFNGNKIITSSGGGMLLINVEDAEEKATKVLFWATQSRERARWYQHNEIGYNYRMSNVAAGIGRGQLKVLEQRVKKKRYIYDYYESHIGNLDGLCLMKRDMRGNDNCWLTAIQMETGSRVEPMAIMKALEEDDVESRPIWKPMHLQPVFEDYDFVSEIEKLKIVDEITGADNSKSGSIFRNGVCLASDTKMTDEDLNRICKVIKRLWR